MKNQGRTVLILGIIALVIAILRYFMKGWVEPLGVSPRVGSFFASLTVLLVIAMIIIFAGEGRAAQGRYVHGALWFLPFVAWCEILVIAGILLTARTGAVTYYEEAIGPGRITILQNPVRHATEHAIAFFPVYVMGLILGAIVYFVAKRGRRTLTNTTQA